MKSDTGNKPPAGAKPGDTVRVHYSCRLDDGSLFVTTEGKEPKEFLIGSTQIMPGLQEAVLDMSVGERKLVEIPPEKGYGPYHDEMTAVLDRSMIPDDLEIEVGVAIRVKHADGHESDAFITAIEDGKVHVDGNHPLAGKNLTMDIEMVAIIQN